MRTLTEAYEECRRLNKYYGTPFFHAINSLPKQILPHIHSVYAFERIAHEMLYNPKKGVKKNEQIKAVKKWQTALEEGVNNSDSTNPYLRALVHTIKVHDIPVKHFEKYTDAKIQDFKTPGYDSYPKLVKSIDATTGRIAEISGIVLGIKNYRPRKKFVNLNQAARLTKLLGKMGKDYERTQICILPKKDLEKFGYSMEDFKNHLINDEWKLLMEHYINKIQSTLDSTQKHLGSFPSTSRLTIENTIEIYNSLLRAIRKKDYDVFSYQPRLSSSLKLRQMLPIFGSLLR